MKKLLVAFAVCLLFSSCSSDNSQNGSASSEALAPACPRSASASCDAAAVSASECPKSVSCPMMQKTENLHKFNDPTNGDYDRMNESFYNKNHCLFMEVPSKNYDVIRWNKFM